MKARQPKRPAGEVVQTSCSLPVEVHERLKIEASREDRSISFMIAKACKEFVERLGRPSKPTS
jgi:predicted transcriptional regulator